MPERLSPFHEPDSERGEPLDTNDTDEHAAGDTEPEKRADKSDEEL
ncbi:MAG: hypothetical protein PHY34_01030 [Patescibacteria group bacterium]|nr:hypothetical protein [Patescibacteria group bacterium]MDD5715195.1 hypothetical protein [Patescibacteria group bacterium]